MKAVTAPMVFTAWIGISVLVGTTLSFLTMLSVPADKLYDLIINGNELGVLIIVFLRWSFLTFACGAPLTWAVVLLGTRFRRPQAQRQSAAERRRLRVSRDE